MKFVEEVEAIQYDGTNKKEIEILTGQRIKRVKCTLFEGDVTRLLIYCPINKCFPDVYNGDWIVKHPNGSLTSMTDKKFKEKYKLSN